jgi:hypothetical protein
VLSHIGPRFRWRAGERIYAYLYHGVATRAPNQRSIATRISIAVVNPCERVLEPFVGRARGHV